MIFINSNLYIYLLDRSLLVIGVKPCVAVGRHTGDEGLYLGYN